MLQYLITWLRHYSSQPQNKPSGLVLAREGFLAREAFDVTNLIDKPSLIHDGTGVGAGQPEYGPRCGFIVGIRKGY